VDYDLPFCSVHDAEESLAVSAGVTAADRWAGS